MSELRILLLGPPRVEVDGRALQFDTRKATALLAYLATSGDVHRRESLAGLLWPEYDDDSARGALRRTLSTLRKGLGGGWLQVDRATVALDDRGVWSDAAELRSLLQECERHGHGPAESCVRCREPLQRATSLYRGDFMAGFSLRDSIAFEDWQLLECERCRRLAATALERLVHCLVAARDLSGAIEQARRWLALEPLHEPAHRRLMLLYAWNDQRSSAIKQYRECVAILDRELGVAPVDETAELYRAVLENRTPPIEVERAEAAEIETTQPTGAARGDYPLTGRAIQWKALLDAYEGVSPDGRLVVVEGEAGIGKTRLCQEFLSQAAGRGAVVISARCHEAETDLTYGPVIDLLRNALRSSDDRSWLQGVGEQWLVEAGRLLPELRDDVTLPAAPPLRGPGAKSRFYEGLARFLSAACSGPPYGLLFFDDVHWVDDASADFLAFLARRLSRRPLCLILAWRTEELPSRHRLARVIAEARRSNRVSAVSLGRLGEAHVGQLVASAASDNGPVPDLAERLFRETDGVPLFVVEYLRALKESGAPPPDALQPPPAIRDVLHSRVAAAGQTAHQVLAAAAVVGGPFDFDTLWRSAGRSAEEVVSALEELLALNLITELDDKPPATSGAYDFSHSLLREFVYQDANAARRRLLHGRVGDALRLTRQRTEGLASVIAGHYELGGRDEDAAAYYELAGQYDRSLLAYGEAIAHFNAALAMGHPDPARLHEAIGDLRTLLGDYKLAVQSYETAAALSEEDALADVEHKLGNVHDRRGDWDAAESQFDAALAALEGKEADPRIPRILADKSLTLHHRNQGERAYQVAEQSLELAAQVRDERSLAQAHNILGILSARRGQRQEARRHLQESLELAAGLSDDSARVAALNNLALVVGADGDYDRAVELARWALELCKSHGDRHREAALNNNLADLLHAAGRSGESMDHLRKAVTMFTEIGADAGDLEPEIWKLVEW
jgi:predicted ATPase/DNA-binding SARP family transcriptional activator